MTSWIALLAMRFILIDGGIAVLVRIWSQRHERTQVFVRQYVIAYILSVCLLLANGAEVNGQQFILVMIIGFAVAWGNYCHWRAVAVSLAKTGVFEIFDDIIAIALGWIVLNEGRFLAPMIGMGLVLALISALFMAHGANFEKRDVRNSNLIPWVLGFSFIWGGAIFSMRYFSVAELMPVPAYAFSWYSGALIGALLVSQLPVERRLNSAPVLALDSKSVWAYSTLLAVLIVGGLYLLTLALTQAPLLIVVPVMLVLGSTIPSVVGLFIFKEWKMMNLLELFGIILGLIAVILVATG